MGSNGHNGSGDSPKRPRAARHRTPAGGPATLPQATNGIARDGIAQDEAVQPLLPTELPPVPPDMAGTPEPTPASAPPSPPGDQPASPAPGPRNWRRRLRLPWPDLGACALYLIGAVYVLQRLIADPRGRVQANVPDQT